MPSRRQLLAASVPLLSATAGCLGGDAPDVRLVNELEREVWVRVTIERESDGEQVFRRTIELPTVGDDEETFQSPVGDPDAEHTMHVLVKNAPESTERFADTLSEPFSPEITSVWIRIRSEGIQFSQVTT
ncbi:hypothetical protein B4589_010195 [Halolamina sp. CBA1230]|uniref:hypothetical protein n=1 Tax=Halolamina sp. CBA1230 TaxID=1853690 RepID=UPI0009A1F46D|nr:hypothetical protein [Halolamina sp. CBA1230]QKY20731.1 hypothetical protein B4589_010195 [Halolamina sp. CBA1230]